MKKLILLSLVGLFSLLMTMVAYADNEHKPILNKVSYQTSVEGWATTKTAKVTVSVDAALSNVELGKLQSQVLQNLRKLAPKAAWHVTQFTRNKSSTGLEQAFISAQARLPQEQLTELREIAKKLSKPGQTYTISAIQFNPTLAEVEQVRSQLRDKIYANVNAELTQLNKAYPKEQFHLYRIVFDQPGVVPVPASRTMALMEKRVQTQTAASMAVSNKIVIAAHVVLAATPAIQ